MGQAGKSTRKMAQSRRRTTSLILVGVLILMILLALALQNARVLGLGGGVILGLLILLRLSVLQRQARSSGSLAAVWEVRGQLAKRLGEER